MLNSFRSERHITKSPLQTAFSFIRGSKRRQEDLFEMAARRVKASSTTSDYSEAGSSSDAYIQVAHCSTSAGYSDTGSTSDASGARYYGSACSSDASASDASTSDQVPTSTSEFLTPEGEPLSVQEMTDRVRQKLIETGRMEWLKEEMERKLSEVGWRSTMMAKCREVVQKQGPNVKYETLFQSVREIGKEMVPKQVKKDALRQIRYCYHASGQEK